MDVKSGIFLEVNGNVVHVLVVVIIADFLFHLM